MEESVQQKFSGYPDDVKALLLSLRELIYRVAKQHDINDLSETLKWGEPSYIAPKGSTIRIDWKEKTPHQYCMYFNCKTVLIETFKEIYSDTLTFEGNRAIVFNVGQTVPHIELSHCISLALRYKKIKHLPLLGA